MNRSALRIPGPGGLRYGLRAFGLAALMAGGCQLVSTGPGTEFSCSQQADCRAAESCCADHICRLTCPQASGVFTANGIASAGLTASSRGATGSTGGPGESTSGALSAGPGASASSSSSTALSSTGTSSAMSAGTSSQGAITLGGTSGRSSASAMTGASATSATGASGSTGTPPPAGTPCATCTADADCHGGLQCNGGFCNSFSQCSSTACKAGGFRCDADDDYCICTGAPLPGGSNGVCGACSSDRDCLAGLTCHGGWCNTFSDCGATPCSAAGFRCDPNDDYCTCGSSPPPSGAGVVCGLCATDADCRPGLSCEGGFCNSFSECASTPCHAAGFTCDTNDDYCRCQGAALPAGNSTCAPCSADSDCRAGLECMGGFCNSFSECGATPCLPLGFSCDSNDDYCRCGAGSCGATASESGTPICGACSSDSSCRAGLQCISGHCNSFSECGATPCTCAGLTCDSNDDGCTCS